MKAGFQKWYIAIIIQNLYCFVNHQSRRFVILVKSSLCFLASLDIIIPREDNVFVCLSFISPWKRFVSWTKILKRLFCFIIFSLRSRRLEVVGERENGRARGRHACLLLARSFFLVPTTSKRLLRRLHYFIYFIFLFQTVHTLILTTVVQKVDSTDHIPSLVNCPPTPPQSENQYLLFT